MTGANPPKIVCSCDRVIHMHVHMHWHKQNAIKKHWSQKKWTWKRKEKFSKDFFLASPDFWGSVLHIFSVAQFEDWQLKKVQNAVNHNCNHRMSSVNDAKMSCVSRARANWTFFKLFHANVDLVVFEQLTSQDCMTFCCFSNFCTCDKTNY